MFKSIRVRASQGTQYIPDPRQADPAGFRGRPVIGERACEPGCRAAWPPARRRRSTSTPCASTWAAA